MLPVHKLKELISKFGFGDELEIRLGYFGDKGFTSKITPYMYNIVLNKLSKFRNETKNQTIIMYENKIKVVEGEGVIKKLRKTKVDIKELGLRVDLSSETYLVRFTDTPNCVDNKSELLGYKQTGIKQRTRISFFPNKIYQVDLTLDIQNGKKHYQVECEFLKKPNIKELIDTINHLGKLNTDLQYYQSIVYYLNKNFYRYEEDKLSDELFRLPEARKIEEYDIPYLSDYIISVKSDGYSSLLLLNTKGVFLVGRTFFKLFLKNPVENLKETIVISGELDNNIFIMRELMPKTVNKDKYTFLEKYAILEDLKQKLNTDMVDIIPIFYKKSLTDNIKDALDFKKNARLMFNSRNNISFILEVTTISIDKLLNLSHYSILSTDKPEVIAHKICTFLHLTKNPKIFDNLIMYTSNSHIVYHEFKNIVIAASRLKMETPMIDILVDYF